MPSPSPTSLAARSSDLVEATGSGSHDGNGVPVRFGDVHTAAEELSRFRCAGCGYGASCRLAPERCPMCGGANWEEDKQRTRLFDLDRFPSLLSARKRAKQ
jgi:hypothetical protein